MKTTLEILSNGIKEQRIEVLLVGGYALQAYGVARQTFDVDCLMVDTDSKKLDEILVKA